MGSGVYGHGCGSTNLNFGIMKKYKIIFWVSTTIIFLFEGVVPAFTSQTALAKEGIRHLGYPEYFGNALVVFKVLGAFVLIVPKFPKRLKEWAYAGFAFNFIFASVSHACVDGFGGQAIFPLVLLGILAASYISSYKLGALCAVTRKINSGDRGFSHKRPGKCTGALFNK